MRTTPILKPRLLAAVGLALAALLAPAATPAQAGYQAPKTFTFDVSNVLGPGTYGTVVIDAYTGAALDPVIAGLNPGEVRFQVFAPYLDIYGGSLSDTSNYGIGKFAFNTGLTILAGQVKVEDKDGTDLPWQLQTDKQMSEFGNFSIRLQETKSARDEPLVITISGLGANATIGNFVNPSSEGFLFAAHVAGFVGFDHQGACVTSHFIAVSHAPEPCSLALALAGLVGVGLAGVRRRRASACKTVTC